MRQNVKVEISLSMELDGCCLNQEEIKEIVRERLKNQTILGSEVSIDAVDPTQEDVLTYEVLRRGEPDTLFKAKEPLQCGLTIVIEEEAYDIIAVTTYDDIPAIRPAIVVEKRD